jgi:hemoglobin
MTDEAEETLYDRIGGGEAVSRLVFDFYQRVLADPELGPFFVDTPVEKLGTMQAEFFSAALGGPIQYTGRSLSDSHAGRGITAQHLRRYLDHLLETLQGFDLSNDDRYDIVSRINTYADEITGATSVDG